MSPSRSTRGRNKPPSWKRWLPSWVTAFTALALATPARAQQGSDSPSEPGATSADATQPPTKPPILLHFVEAEFPDLGPDVNEAAVLLDLWITDSGTVHDARVVESAGPEFDEAALLAARGFLFEPATVEGRPAAVKLQYRYEFKRSAPATTPTVLRGEVRDQKTGKPLPGVSVRLDTGEAAMTDEHGAFAFDAITPGERTLTLEGPFFGTLQTSETAAAGQTVSVRYDVEVASSAPGTPEGTRDDLEILVVAPKRQARVVATRVEAESARKVAGTGGDVLKVVENMPGVARAAAGAGDVVVWGASPKDTRVYIDDVRVPALYHFGGFRSVLHSDLVQSVELVPGGYGAPYGRGLGGLITVDTRSPSAAGWGGSVQADLLDASLALHGPVGSRIGVMAAARRSHLDEVFRGLVTPETAAFFPIPEYYDGSVRLRYSTGADEWVEVGALTSDDVLARNVPSNDPASRKSETRGVGFTRVLLRYRRDPGDGTQVTVVPWFGRDRHSLHAVTGSVPVTATSHVDLFGVRAAWVGAVRPNVAATAGMDVEISSSEQQRNGSLSAPPREGDARVFGQPPADQVNADHWKVVTGSAAPYAEADVSLFDDRLHVTPGLRLEPFFTSVNRRRPAEPDTTDVGAFDAELSLQPRFSARYQPAPRVTLKLAYGRYRQAADADDSSSVFGNPLLGTANATHYLFGSAVQLSTNYAFESTAFYTRSEELAVRNPVATPRVAEALVAEGQGRAYGLQLMLRKDLSDGLFGWLAYTLMRSERKDAGSTNWRLFDFDQTHVLTALLSYDLGNDFEVGTRARVSSGYPRTPVVAAYYDARRDQYEPELGRVNGTRIPTFFQVDARASKRWKVGGGEIEAYLDVLNVMNRSNPEEIAYSADYGARRYINGLPLLPVVGGKWNF